jgi:hypothetical protein
LHAALAVDSLRRKSVSYDEVSHLPAGLAAVAAGEPRLNPQHPPLLKLLAGAAAATARPRLPLDGAAYREGREWDFGREVLFASGNDDARLLLRGRLPSVLLSLLAAVVIWSWSRARWGEAGGLLSLALWCASPVALAHARLVTMDVPVAAFAALATLAWWRAARRGLGGAWLGVAAAALGAAAATKFSALLLPAPLLLAEWLACGSRTPWRRRLGAWGILALGTAAMIHVAYQFSTDSLLRYVDGMSRLYQDLPRDYAFYLAGEFRAARFPHYFLVALAVKSTVPELFAMAGGLLAAGWRRLSWRDDLFLWLPAVTWLAATSALASDQGVRYAIPALPFLFVLAGRLAAPSPGTSRRWLGPAVALMLGALQIGAAVSQHPDYIPYFNRLAGGVAAGPRWLDDSNVDWGEDLRRLPAWLAARGVERVRLAYFGINDPERYGIRREPFTRSDWCVEPRPGAYVVSAHVLVRGLLEARTAGCRSDWLDRYRPRDVLGGSLYLYVFEPAGAAPR